jgi:hypothetical protein
MKIMEKSLVFIVCLLIKISVYGQIYLFWLQKVLPALQNHYFIVKGDVAVPECTYAWWNRINEALQIYYHTVKTLVPALYRHIYISIRYSEFLHRNFPAVMRHISKWIHVESESRMATSGWNNGNSRWKDDESEWKHEETKWKQ